MSTVNEGTPAGWAETTLQDLLAGGLFSDGDWVESKDQDPAGDVRLIQLADLGDGVYRNRSNRFLTTRKANELKCTFLAPGDILVARMPEPLGRACIFPGDTKAAVTVVDVCILRPPGAYPDARWLANTLNCPSVRSRILELQSGSTRQRISRRNLAAIRIPVPSLAEQYRIVDKLDALLSDLDVEIAALNRSLKKLKRYRHAVFKAAVEGGLSREWRDSNQIRGVAWTLTSVGEIGAVTGGLTKNPKRERCNLRLPYLRVANVYAGELRLDGVENMGLDISELQRASLQRGDLLVVEGNGSPDQIGRVAVWDGSIEPCVHQNHIIKVRFDDPKLSEWAELFLLSPVGRDKIREAASSTSGLYTLSISKVSALPIAIPPEEERVAILSEVNRLTSVQENLATSLRANLLRAARLRQSILEKAFRGELVPQDPNDEPASVLLERIRAERAASAQSKLARTRKPRAQQTPVAQ